MAAPTASLVAAAPPAATSSGHESPRGRYIALVIGVAVLARIAWLTTATELDLAQRISDDAYYYFQVARNVTHGLGWTFDGQNPTNGFHPLWMAMLLPVYAVAGHDPLLALRAVSMGVTLLAGLVGLAGWAATRSLAGPRAALTAVLLMANPFALAPLLNGLETGVMSLLLFALAWLALRHDLLALDAGWRRDAALGTLLGATLLARLDTVFLAPALMVVIGARAARPGGLPVAWGPAARKLAVAALACAVVVAPYLAWNHARFEHLVPISGALKSTFPSVSFTVQRLRSFHALYGAAQLAVAGTLLLAWAVATRNGARRGARTSPAALAVCGLLFGANVLHFAYTMLFVSWGANWWHFASYVPTTICAVALALAWLDERTGRRAAWLVTVVAVTLAAHAAADRLDRRRRGEVRAHWYEAMAWARRELPRNAVVAMTDCGFFGYSCGHPTVNLDGVINGYAYQAALRDHRLSAYLEANGVTHVGSHLTRYVDGAMRIRLPALLHRGAGGAIVATPQAEVYRSAPFAERAAGGVGGPVQFVIWDLRRVEVIDDAGAGPPRGRAGPGGGIR
jgi:hypothetical protein